MLLPLRADYLAPVLPQLFHSVVNIQNRATCLYVLLKKYSMARVMMREPEM